MTIEIKELLIKASVDNSPAPHQPQYQQQSPQSFPSQSSQQPSPQPAAAAMDQSDEVIKRCVEQVLRTLARQRSR